MSTSSPRASGSRTAELRANALAGLIMLLIEYSLGISVNLTQPSPPPTGTRACSPASVPRSATAH